MQEGQKRITLDDLKEGSDKALKQVYEENRTKFLNFARKYGLSDEENVDVYQDAYIVFYENVMGGKIKNLTSSISTYLFSIGKYLIFNRMKKHKRKTGREFNPALVGKVDEVMANLDLNGQEMSHEQRLLQKYFTTLGKQCQELLTLFYYRGFTIQEIMEHKNYNSENVVKAAKSRCMKTLKERIKANKV